MEKEQTAGSCPAPRQTAVRTWLSSSTRGVPRTHSDTTSRFQGDGVRYKAKLIGVDMVPDAQGDKMCWESMMKLKGFEAAARKQGKHKQRVWLKVSSGGLKIVDERTGAVLYDHDRIRISSLMKDKSDPRALAYVYQHQDTYSLFYIKMANLADPVLVDIEDVLQVLDQETPQELSETNSLLLLHDSSARPAEAFFSKDLMEVFSIQTEEPLAPQSSCTTQQESPQPSLSTSQILSMFPIQPVGGSPYSSPPYSPTTMPWSQQVLLGNQWAGPAVAPWPTMPGHMVAAWAPAGMAAPTAGSQILAHCSQPGAMITPPTTANRYPTTLNSSHAPTGAAGSLQSVSPTLDHNPFLS
ncbi:disabled homolog 1-like isoform X1 [Micropterus salmoides]|uniref:disabled homolog 1-like isoform X1 n=1 Tax=Micropterus salmoides TaxID=27706 RepID=UPI0018EBD40D|nr:disabled homolog 1-like isoform X1 [Micropterus salmoides]XP_038571477.1 disabled homolog 1-like isoform X1 [Micropterus salmoides]XP_038571478.1 disabled homolog 1-like isoform X1 [Micropterus salmoides]XP_038571479.1 disabled homolog 1-like isoform X1 [Micropterus salmoides]